MHVDARRAFCVARQTGVVKQHHALCVDRVTPFLSSACTNNWTALKICSSTKSRADSPHKVSSTKPLLTIVAQGLVCLVGVSLLVPRTAAA